MGNLFKKGNDKKSFLFGDSDSTYFRYFTLYFKTAKMFIDKDSTSTQDRKVIEFRSILDCSEYEGQIMLVTDKRKYELFAGNKDERNMWIAGFNFVVNNNKE